MADINFSCTSCGRCCHDLRLPLTRGEAIDWLVRGGTVEILCEATPWLAEPDPSDQQLLHRQRRSFPGMSGNLPVRVTVVLTAIYVGACPHLTPEFRCGIYESRPHVCRIYPAEINPFIKFSPANKLCPPEAWASSSPLIRNDEIVDDEVRLHVALSRHEDALQALSKQVLCADLGIATAGLSNEGFALHAPSPERLLEALRKEPEAGGQLPFPTWTIASNQANTVNALKAAGAESRWTSSTATDTERYIGFRSDAAGE